MSLAHKSWEAELRRPARLFISRTGSWAQGGSAPAHGVLLCNLPCARGIKVLLLLWGKKPQKGDVSSAHFILFC